jgi:hypothetical protein
VIGIGDIQFDFSQRHRSLAYCAFDNKGMALTYDEANSASVSILKSSHLLMMLS